MGRVWLARTIRTLARSLFFAMKIPRCVRPNSLASLKILFTPPRIRFSRDGTSAALRLGGEKPGRDCTFFFQKKFSKKAGSM